MDEQKINTAEVCIQSLLQPGNRDLQMQKDKSFAQSKAI